MKALAAILVLGLAACATPAHEHVEPMAQAAPAQAAPEPNLAMFRAETAMNATCAANPQNAEEELNFVCSLQSADFAHLEAGRGPVPHLGCAPGAPCVIENTSLVIRILHSPSTGMGEVPHGSSIEVTGFDRPRAHVDVRELVGLREWTPMTDAPVTPPPMRPGAVRAFDLSPEATARILALALASALRENLEPPTWLACRVDPEAGSGQQAVTLFATDLGGSFVQLFFGSENHAYLRNGAYYGQAGRIAALAMGVTSPDSGCRRAS
jgi:hypothetical protein